MAPVFDIVVPAAGSGSRMLASLGGAAEASFPKQYMTVSGVAILELTLQRLIALKPRRICLVVAEGDEQWRELPSVSQCEIAQGGATRGDSVLAGINALAPDENDLILVHDCVRPLFSAQSVTQLISSAASHADGAILALPVTDTLKQADQTQRIQATFDRSEFWLAQTPQAFSAGLIQRALQTAKQENREVTDEASAVEALGKKPALVEGSKHNIKITTAEDLALAEFLLGLEATQCE